jgi:hypothetical protein
MKLSANVSQPSALRKFKFTDALRAPLLFDGCFPVSKFQAVVKPDWRFTVHSPICTKVIECYRSLSLTLIPQAY